MKTKLWNPWIIGLLLAACGWFVPQTTLAQPGGGFGGFNRGAMTSGRVATPRVIAVADELSNSLIVSASEEQMVIISNLIAQLDAPIDDAAELRVFKLEYADPQETVNQLALLFPDPTTQTGGRNRGQFGGGQGGRAAATTAQTQRTLNQSRVTAVADMRTGAVIVSAAPALMEQIAQVIARLDSDPRRMNKVFVIPVENSDPTATAETLRGLFEGQNSRTRGTASRTTAGSRTQPGNQLNNRAVRNQNQGASSSGFGSSFGTRTSTMGQ